MVRLLQAVVGSCLALAGLASGAETWVDQKVKNAQKCSGMYSRKDWGGPVAPYVSLKFVAAKSDDRSKKIGWVIFEWEDRELIGRDYTAKDGHVDIKYVCDHEAIEAKMCNQTHRGEFLLADGAMGKWHTKIATMAVDPISTQPIRYAVTSTGYYCVGTFAEEGDYAAVVEFRNAYGELAADQISKLPFFGGTTIAYALVAFYWAFLYWQHRMDVLKVQRYITGILAFLPLEMLVTWLFYDYTNRNGTNTGSKVLLIVVAILNAARNAYSFFLLLILCMGYSVVVDSLGAAGKYARLLGAGHFVFGVIYAIASLTVRPEDVGPLILLVIFPLSATLTAFYIWTLNALSYTIHNLELRKQTVKQLMYRRLRWCIATSIIVIFLFFFFNSFTIVGTGSDEITPIHWKSRWFILDGWLNVVYFIDVCYIAYLWRPTRHNRRFAMSDQLPSDDDFGGDNDFALEAQDGHAGEVDGQRYEGMRTTQSDQQPTEFPRAGGPEMGRKTSRHDGSVTVFAVGSGHSSSEEDTDSEESGFNLVSGSQPGPSRQSAPAHSRAGPTQSAAANNPSSSDESEDERPAPRTRIRQPSQEIIERGSRSHSRRRDSIESDDETGVGAALLSR